MARIPQLRIQIGGDPIINMQTVLKFHLMESPNILNAPQRAYETEVYPENSGVKVHAVTTTEQFDYKVKLCFFGTTLAANAAIVNFYASLFTKSGDLMKAKELVLYNDFKGIKIVGYAKSQDISNTIFEVAKDVVMFDFVIQITNPNKCVFK